MAAPAERGTIVADQLTRVFNGKVRAVDGVSFSVAKGEVYGFLGPNGAGKTTTVSMLTAGLGATSGRATVDGVDVLRHPEEVKRRIGIVFQEMTSDGDLTGRENLELSAALYGVPRGEVAARVSGLLERMQVADAADRLAKTYSGGMRRRLELAVGTVHSPSVLFLDEPTLGLDPQGRAGFWKYVQDLRRDHGMTVFLTTHYLEEADGLCDRIAIIDHGHIVKIGTPDELKASVGGDVILVGVKETEPDVSSEIAKVDLVKAVTKTGNDYRIKADDGAEATPAIIDLIRSKGMHVSKISLSRPTLDEAYLELTGRTLREEETNRWAMMSARRTMNTARS